MSTVDTVEILLITALTMGVGFWLGWWWRGDNDEREFRKWKHRHYQHNRRDEFTP